MYLAQGVDFFTQLVKALDGAGIQGALLVFVIFIVIGFLLGRLVLRNDKAKIDKDTAITTSLSTAVTILTTNLTKLSDNAIEMQTGARKRDEQMNLIIKAMNDGAEYAKQQNEKLDKIAAAAILSGDQTKANRENSDANTVKIITSIEGVPQATAALLIDKFNELEIAISHLAANVSPDSVKNELAQLKIDFEKALENYLKRTTQNDVDLKAADKRIDELTHPTVVAIIGQPTAEDNRKALDDQPKEDAA